MSNYLDAKHLAGSAYAVTTETPGTIYLGHCQRDDRPVRFDFATDQGPAADIPCPACTELITGERVHAVTTHVECDGQCRSARRASCDCACGGVNHGNTWTVGYLLGSRQVVESELAKFRSARQHRREQAEGKRAKRREAEQRRAKVQFDNWAEDHAELVKALEAHAPDELNRPPEGGHEFLTDLARQIGHGKVLTEGQTAAAERVLAGQAKRAERERQWAEEKAKTPPAPAGKAIPVEGTIVKVRAREGFRQGTVQLQAVVKTAAGYVIQVTLPSKVEAWARNNRPRIIFRDFRERHYGWNEGIDYAAAGSRWTDALKGSRLAFTAGEVTPWQKDPTLGFAKRPSRVEFTPAEEQPEPQEQRQAQ